MRRAGLELRHTFRQPSRNVEKRDGVRCEDIGISHEHILAFFILIADLLVIQHGNVARSLDGVMNGIHMGQFVGYDIPNPFGIAPELVIKSGGVDFHLVIDIISAAVGIILVVLDDNADLGIHIAIHLHQRLPDLLGDFGNANRGEFLSFGIINDKMLCLVFPPVQLRLILGMQRGSGKKHKEYEKQRERRRRRTYHLSTPTLTVSECVRVLIRAMYNPLARREASILISLATPGMTLLSGR